MSDDDDSSYESVANARIGRIYEQEEQNVNETEEHDAIPPPAVHEEHGTRKKQETEAPTTLRQIFPPFFFPTTEMGNQLHHHLNRRRTWGSSAYLYAQREIIASVIPATLFRVAVAVFHLSLRNRSQANDHISLTDSSSSDIVSVPVTEVISYLHFLARESQVRIPGDKDESSWRDFFPALVEASRESISGKQIICNLDSAIDPLALEVDLVACNSVSLSEWKAFLGISDPPPIDLTDISSDTLQLIEWWKSLERTLEGARLGLSDGQSLYDFLVAYCKTIDDAVLKCTCRGMTFKLGSIEKRKCGMLLDNLGHHPSSKAAYFRFTTRRLVACDLARVFGNMKISVGFLAGISNNDAAASTEAENGDSIVGGEEDIKHVLRSRGESDMETHSLQPRNAAELDPFSYDDQEDDRDDDLVRMPRMYRRLKRRGTITTNGTPESARDRKVKMRSENQNSSSHCEVTRAMQAAQATYRTHSDEDDDDSDSV